jgi:multidrug efflux pump subunit AcrB
MWIVLLALRRPYTFAVTAILIVIMGAVSIARMNTDILPEVNIPVVSVIWSYTGIAPDEMAKRLVTVTERAMTTTVNDIEHIESQSLRGVGVIKVFFQPRVQTPAAVAQVTAICQTLLRTMPPGTTPPLILQYSASNVPILQIGISGQGISENELYDYGLQFIRTQLVTVRGAQIPLPYGGAPRQVMVDLDPDALLARGLSPEDVTNAVNAQNLILPAGTAKFGPTEYDISLNSSPRLVETINNLPIRPVNGAMVYIRDVAHVREGSAVQTNVVRVNGIRSALLTVLKTLGSSTLTIVDGIRRKLPEVSAIIPPQIKLEPLFDQSVFVRGALYGVLTEGGIAAGLTALMILLFLGSWRSTLIVATSIPLSILVSVIVLYALGQTLNIMTLGGMALAVGILVDDATVEIENVHRHMGMGKSLLRAILDGANEVATPAFVSTLSICIVFVPVFFLTGPAGYLFAPLAMAVAFAMLASYFLSRTLVPNMVQYLLPAEMDRHGAHGSHGSHGSQDGHDGHDAPRRPRRRSVIERVSDVFGAGFERFRGSYTRLLSRALRHRIIAVGVFVLLFGSASLLYPMIGYDFFPTVDAGQFRLGVRAPPGTRIEETERRYSRVQDLIREVIPPGEIALVVDNIGIPVGGVNLAFSASSVTGPADGEMLVSLREGHGPTGEYIRRLREELPKRFPGCTFFFAPADIVGQILNFGLPSPVDVQVVGLDPNATLPVARDLVARIAKIPGAADVHLHQVTDVPGIRLNVDRTRAEELGITQRQVASNMLISLSGTGQVAPNFWLNPKTGVNYAVVVQTPERLIPDAPTLLRTPIPSPNTNVPTILGNLATPQRVTRTAVENHYNVLPVFDVYASVQGRDLGGVAADIDAVLDEVRPHLPRGVNVVMRGQVQTMRESFVGLGLGLLFAVALVYLLMAVNFQSWLDPLIILMALPGAMGGILLMLFATGTTLSVPALMGAIMSIGVATANSILMVVFANERRTEGADPVAAALEAGSTRLRPVIMTATAMILGMLPMSLGVGEGGEQNAPLGRAVIGGIIAATVTTLLFVPVVYSLLRTKRPLRDEELPEELRGGV